MKLSKIVIFIGIFNLLPLTHCFSPTEYVKESLPNWDPVMFTSIGFVKKLFDTTDDVLGTTYRLITPVNFEPTLQNLHTYTFTPCTISDPQASDIRSFINQLKADAAPEHAIISIKRQSKKRKKSQSRVTKSDILRYQNITQGVPVQPCPRIAMFSRGHKFFTREREGGSVLDTYAHIRDNVIPFNIPTVTFDYPDERRSLNIGQRLDQDCFKLVYNAITVQNPDAKITLFGLCKGGFNNLKFLADNPVNAIDTVVLHSTFASAKKLVEMRMQTVLGMFAVKPIRYAVKLCLPNYDENQDNLLSIAHTIADKKIIIGHLIGDPFVCPDDLNALITILRQKNEVYLILLEHGDFADNKGIHGKLYLSEKYQCAVNAFLKKCNIEHDVALAKMGEKYLKDANTVFVL